MKKTRNALAAVAVASLAASSLLLASPAHALVLDVSGTKFNFANPGDADILANATAGASYFYENIATVNGSQIDATVTFVESSLTSMGMNDYSEIDADALVLLNNADPDSVDVAGCYSSAAYLLAMENNDIWWDTFFDPGDLLVGGKIEEVDEFQDDPAIEGAINTDVDLCQIVDPTDGYVEIQVDFEVGGSPVTLNNLELFAGDIDYLQSLTFFNPMPTSYSVSPTTKLTVTEVGGSVEFKAPDIGSDETDPDAADFVGEASYSGVSSVSYRFGIEDAGSGSLSMLFDSYFDTAPTAALPDTGVDVTASAVVGGSLLALGVAVVLLMRRRRQAV